MEQPQVQSIHRGSTTRVGVFIVYVLFVLIFASQIVDEWHLATYSIFGLLLLFAYLLISDLMKEIRIYQHQIVIYNAWQFWRSSLVFALEEVSYVQLIEAYRSQQMVVHFQEKSPQHGFKRKVSISSFNYAKLKAGLIAVGVSVH